MRCRTIVVLAVLALAVGCVTVGTETIPGQPLHHVEGGFRNLDPEFTRAGDWARWSFLARRTWSTLTAQRSFNAPRVANDGSVLRAGLDNPSVTWIGHSTLLVQVNGLSVLTDPHWGNRASPLSWAGPRRLSPPVTG